MPKNNDRTHNIYMYSPKKINESFCKNGYIYLLKGAENNYSDGLKSRFFREGIRLNNASADIEQLTFYQSIGVPTPFISMTTNYQTAASFALDGKIYVAKIPCTDVYCSSNSAADILKETEYLVPDIIYSDEIVKVFKVDDFRGIYNYLKNEIGLKIAPEDIGLSSEMIVDGRYIPGLGVILPNVQCEIADSDTKGFAK